MAGCSRIQPGRCRNAGWIFAFWSGYRRSKGAAGRVGRTERTVPTLATTRRKTRSTAPVGEVCLGRAKTEERIYADCPAIARRIVHPARRMATSGKGHCGVLEQEPLY